MQYITQFVTYPYNYAPFLQNLKLRLRDNQPLLQYKHYNNLKTTKIVPNRVSVRT